MSEGHCLGICRLDFSGKCSTMQLMQLQMSYTASCSLDKDITVIFSCQTWIRRNGQITIIVRECGMYRGHYLQQDILG